MSFTYSPGTVSLTSSILRDCCWDEGNNRAVVVESQSNRILQYDDTGALYSTSSSGVSGGLSSVTLINAASAYFASNTTSTTSVGLMELAGGYVQLYNIGTSRGTRALGRGQQAAGDISSSIAFSCTNADATLVKFNGGTFTASQPTIANMQTGERCNAILLKESGRWLVGSNKGKVYEIDSNASVLNVLTLGYPETVDVDLYTAIAVTGLSYSSGILSVMTEDGILLIYNYDTSTLMSIHKVGDSTTSTGDTGTNGGSSCLCDAASGYTLYAANYITGNNSVLSSLDMTKSDWPFQDILYAGSANTTVATAINRVTGMCVVLRTSLSSATQNFAMLQFTPNRSTNSYTSSMEYPTGTPVAGRLIRIRDGGVGSAQIELDTQIPAGGQDLPTTAGEDVIEVVLTQTGTNQAASVSLYESS